MWGFSSLFSLLTWPQPGRAQPVLVMNTEVPHSVYVPCLAIHNSSKLHQLWKSCLLISWARIIVSHKQDSLPLFDLESELVCKGPAGQHTPSIVTSYTMLTRTAHNIPRAVSLSSRTIVTLPWLVLGALTNEDKCAKRLLHHLVELCCQFQATMTGTAWLA